MPTKSADTYDFERLSKQRLDFQELPGGGARARLTLTLPNRRAYTFVEEITAADVRNYATHIAGAEIGYAIADGSIGYAGANIDSIIGASKSDLMRRLSSGGLAAAAGNVVKGVGNVAKKIVTSKVMQTAAKGLQMAAPALGPYAPVAMAVGGGVGIAGKVLASKTAAEVGAPRAAMALAQGAIQDATQLTGSKAALGSLLTIANDKANSAAALIGPMTAARKGVSSAMAQMRRAPAAAAPAASGGGGDIVSMARAGRVRSNRGGAVTPSQLQAAHAAGRIFFVQA